MASLRFKDWKISTKINVVSFITILVFVLGVLLYLLPLMSAKMLEEKRTATKSIIDVAYSLVTEYEVRAEQGEFSVQEAQRRALLRIKSLRYGNNDYIWVNDMQPKMLMHPFQPDLDGKDLSDYKDPNGKKLFVEMVNACKDKGEGFVDYYWPRPGTGQPVPKISVCKALQTLGMGHRQWNLCR